MQRTTLGLLLLLSSCASLAGNDVCRITSYNVCYTKLLRAAFFGAAFLATAFFGVAFLATVFLVTAFLLAVGFDFAVFFLAAIPEYLQVLPL